MMKDNEENERDCFDQGVIENEVRKFYMNLYVRRPTCASKDDIY